MVKTPKKKGGDDSVHTPSPVLPAETGTKESDPVPATDINAPLVVEEINSPSEVIPIEKKNNLLYLSGIIFVGLITLSSLTLFYFLNKDRGRSRQIQPVQITQTEVKSTPVPFNKSLWTIEVLNGSGQAGAANLAAGKLTDLGFQVTKIGNADRSNYSNVSVFLSPELNSFSMEFMNVITTVYPGASLSGTLNTSSPAARLIIGK